MKNPSMMVFTLICTIILKYEVTDIIKTNRRRWEIEASSRIMKSEFKARPAYLRRDDRITVHFIALFPLIACLPMTYTPYSGIELILGYRF